MDEAILESSIEEKLPSPVLQEEELPPNIKDKMTMLTIRIDPKFIENSQWVKRWIRHRKVATNFKFRG
jgi:hypothetical protein